MKLLKNIERMVADVSIIYMISDNNLVNNPTKSILTIQFQEIQLIKIETFDGNIIKIYKCKWT